jgi:hypothetical protein
MGCQTYWVNDEKSILEIVYSAGWTWDDYFSAIDAAYLMITSQSHVVYAISNLNRTKFPPMKTSVLTQWNIAASRYSIPENLGLTVICGQTGFAAFLTNTFVRLSTTKMRFASVDNREMALREIDKIREAATN